ncbi:hypothetical protein QL285_021885 [Trifolium repens]|nr:hypothetical protein QL285_021885 [Trifolium repens]
MRLLFGIGHNGDFPVAVCLHEKAFLSANRAFVAERSAAGKRGKSLFLRKRKSRYPLFKLLNSWNLPLIVLQCLFNPIADGNWVFFNLG